MRIILIKDKYKINWIAIVYNVSKFFRYFMLFVIYISSYFKSNLVQNMYVALNYHVCCAMIQIHLINGCENYSLEKLWIVYMKSLNLLSSFII